MVAQYLSNEITIRELSGDSKWLGFGAAIRDQFAKLNIK